MVNKSSSQNGPDPEVQQSATRLSQTQLSPLEEVMFNSWANANQLEDHENSESPFDYRGLYQSTGGKVFPPGQLKNMIQQKSDMDTMMQAHQQHEQNNPLNLLKQ